MNRIETKKLSKNELLSLNFLRGRVIIKDDETPALAQGAKQMAGRKMTRRVFVL